MQLIELERDRAYTELRTLILSGALRYDEALSERLLGARFKVGRTPMREAVRRLVTEGLLTSLPARGVFVTRFDERDLCELYAVRIALEGMAARLAAETASEDDLAAMARLIALIESEDEPQAIQDAGWAFHRQIFSAAGNQQLASLYETIINRVIVAMRMTLRHDESRVRATVAEHAQIYEAIAARQAEAAEAAMRDHLSGALKSRLALAETFRSASDGPAETPQNTMPPARRT